MAETKLVVDNREQLWTLLVAAAQIEHLVMCQYLYAGFSLKTDPDEGLTAEQADAVARWKATITGIAIEEMLHLALITNVMTAIGAGPTLSRPNFPRHSEYLPPGVEFALLPFGGDSLTHFLYLERPEGMERVDAAEFAPAAPPPAPVAGTEVMPRPQDFLTVGHLYRGIEQGLDDLASQLGEQVLFVGEPRAQAIPERFHYPQLIAVTDLASAHAAIDEIIEQGEGARGDWRPAHYGRFLGIWTEYQKLREHDPSFEPARPVMPAFTQQPYDLDQPQPQPTDPLTREVAELFNLGYEVLLHLLTRFFTHTDETGEQLDTLVGAAFGIMTGVLKPLGTALTRLPFGPGSPDHTAGAAFQMYYQIGNFVPWREAAWVLLSERAAIMSRRCAETARHAGVPDAVNSAAAAAAGIARQIARYVPDNLRPPEATDRGPRSSPRLTAARPPATEPRDKERPMAVSFATNIRPMFTDMDIAHMNNFGILLDDFGFMRDPANAQKVLNQVSSGAMPPNNSGETSWSPDQVELFRNWITDGYQA